MTTLHDSPPRIHEIEAVRSPSPEPRRQGRDYDDRANVQRLHSAIAGKQGDISLTIKPFPLWALVVCGLAIFFTGFFWSHYGTGSGDASISSGNAAAALPNGQSLPADTNKAATVAATGADAKAGSIVHVIIKNMKFDPPSVEVKEGDTVEWKNEDITPHTATSATFDSASIDSDKSWKHTFTKSGSFSYACTFHPEMKAVVIVR